MSRRRQRKRFTLQMKDLVFHSLLRMWDTFSALMLAKEWEYCWGGKDLSNHNYLTTFSTYTLSWYTKTWLGTISLATRRIHFCFAYLLFQSSRLETIQPLDSTYTIRHSATCNSNRCSKTLVIVFKLDWETRAAKRYSLLLLLSLVLFWCL